MSEPARARLHSALTSATLLAVAIAIALALSALLVALTHGPSGSVVSSLYDGSINGWGSFGATFDAAAPLLLVALGTIVTVRAGEFNIGQEGQLAVGALAGTIVAVRVGGPGPLVLVLALAAAALGGALWAGIAALLRYWRGIDIVIGSLLLVFIAGQLVAYAVNSPGIIQEPGPAAQRQAESAQLAPGVRLPRLGHYPNANVGTGFVLALALAAVLAVALARSRWGFRLRILGHNPVAARRAGISAAVVGAAAIVLSGAFAGLAGGVMLTGAAYRLTPAFSNNVGWTGLLVALVARNDVGAAVATALLFGALDAGGGFLSTVGIPSDLVPVVQALVVLGVVLPGAVAWRRTRRTELAT